MTTQHVLMNELQASLEKACYNFAIINMPQVLEEREWSCAECIELNVWSKLMVEVEDKMSDEALETAGKPVSGLLADVAQIRHTAVHRLPVTVSRIEQFLNDAVSLTRVLDDDVHRELVARLRQKTETAVEDIKRNKDLLESRGAVIMRRIRRQQSELERELRTSMDEMLQEDREFQRIKGRAIERAILTTDDAGTSLFVDSVDGTVETWIEQEGKVWKEREILSAQCS